MFLQSSQISFCHNSWVWSTSASDTSLNKLFLFWAYAKIKLFLEISFINYSEYFPVGVIFLENCWTRHNCCSILLSLSLFDCTIIKCTSNHCSLRLKFWIFGGFISTVDLLIQISILLGCWSSHFKFSNDYLAYKYP